MRTAFPDIKVKTNDPSIIRLGNGKVAEHWETADTMSLMQQIGAVAA